MGSPFNPIRDQVRSEMLAALAKGATLTTNELYSVCPSAVDARDVSRLAYELRKKGVIAAGEPVLNALGVRVNSFFLPTITDPRIEAAKPIQVERKIPRTVKAKKPAATNPYAQFSVSKPKAEAPRVTRDLPIHLQSAAPIAAQEAPMSQEPAPYIVNPPFALEPSDPEAEADIDSDLVDALMGLAHMEPKDAEAEDVLAMASADVGEIAQALKEKKTPEPLLSHHANKGKVCQCINNMPKLPKGFLFGGLKVWLESEHDIGRMVLCTVDEGGGAFVTLKANGRLSFDTGELVAIGKVADALIKLHEDMNHE